MDDLGNAPVAPSPLTNMIAQATNNRCSEQSETQFPNGCCANSTPAPVSEGAPQLALVSRWESPLLICKQYSYCDSRRGQKPARGASMAQLSPPCRVAKAGRLFNFAQTNPAGSQRMDHR